MSHVSSQSLATFLSSLTDPRFSDYIQDLVALGSDDCVDLNELTNILDKSSSYEKRRLAYEALCALFPNESKAIAKPIPSPFDSASTALAGAIDHYTAPWEDALDAALSDYDKNQSFSSAAWQFIDRADDHLDSVSQTVAYTSPLQAVSDSASAVMQQHFESDHRLSLPYTAAAVIRTVDEIPNLIVNGTAALVDLPLYAFSAIGTGLYIAGKDAVSEHPDDITYENDYYPGLTDECLFWNGAYSTTVFLGHALRLAALAYPAVFYGHYKALSRTDDSSYIGSYYSNYWDVVGSDVKPLIGYDENDPDKVSRGLRVVSAIGAYAVPTTKSGRTLVPEIIRSKTSELHAWAKVDRFAPKRAPKMPHTDPGVPSESIVPNDNQPESKPSIELKPIDPQQVISTHLIEIAATLDALTKLAENMGIEPTEKLQREIFQLASDLQSRLAEKSIALDESAAELPLWLEREAKIKELAKNNADFMPLMSAMDTLLYTLECQGYYHRKPWLAGESLKDFTARSMRMYRTLKEAKTAIEMDPSTQPVIVKAEQMPLTSPLEGQSFIYNGKQMDAVAESTAGGPAWKLRQKPSQDAFALSQNAKGVVSLVVTDGGSSGANGLGASHMATQSLAEAYQGSDSATEAFARAHLKVFVDMNFMEEQNNPSFAVASSVSVTPNLGVTLARVGDVQAVTIRDGAVLEAGDLRIKTKRTNAVENTLGGGHDYNATEPVAKEFQGQSGDLILTASDHFWDLISIEEILRYKNEYGDNLAVLHDHLMRLAYVRNNKAINPRMNLSGDNLTLGIIRLKEPKAAIAAADPRTKQGQLAPVDNSPKPPERIYPPQLIEPLPDELPNALSPLDPANPAHLQESTPRPNPEIIEMKLGKSKNAHLDKIYTYYAKTAVYTVADPFHPILGELEMMNFERPYKFKLTQNNGQSIILYAQEILAIRDPIVDLTEFSVGNTVRNPSIRDKQVISLKSMGHTSNVFINFGDPRVILFLQKFSALRERYENYHRQPSADFTLEVELSQAAWQIIREDMQFEAKPFERAPVRNSTIGDILSSKLAIHSELLTLWQMAMQFIGLPSELQFSTDPQGYTHIDLKFIDENHSQAIPLPSYDNTPVQAPLPIREEQALTPLN